MNLLRTCKRLPLAVALALVMISAGWAQAQGGKPDCYLVSAGIDNYLHNKKLNGDVNDARNTTKAFAAQRGKLFGKVHADTLLDGQATHANIQKKMQAFSRLGKAGDFFVVFLSGHGGVYNDSKAWYFCCYDENAKNNIGDLPQGEILKTADALVHQGKKVVIIIDACFSGCLAEAAKPYLGKYRDAKGGGLILALSSSPTQTSQALGQYSAFTKAFTDGMNRAADYNRDGKITLQELKTYSFRQTNELLRKRNNPNRQDSQVIWSPSISAHMPLAFVSR